MRSQQISTERAETPEELEEAHMKNYFEGYDLVRGNLGFFLADYDKDFPEPEDEADLKALYSSTDVGDQPRIEFILEYTGNFDDLEDYYSEVATVRKYNLIDESLL